MRGRVKSQQITRGGKASFACDEGNTMIGQSTITCKGKGIWTSRIPKCTTSKFTAFRNIAHFIHPWTFLFSLSFSKLNCKCKTDIIICMDSYEYFVFA